MQMNKKCEMEDAIFSEMGRPVVYDVHLADWLGVDLERLRQFVLDNSTIIPAAFVIRLDDKGFRQVGVIESGPGREVRRNAVFAFTIHGVILINACLPQHDKEAINPQIVRLLAILKEKKTTG